MNTGLGFCYQTAKIWQFIGYLFLVLKIVIPLLIIILGTIDLAKAIIDNDEKQISKSARAFIIRLVAGIVIFFIPTIIYAIFFAFSQFNDTIKNDFKNCFTCIKSPKGDCNTSYSGKIIDM